MRKNMIRFGIIGLGLMGREFASAASRWAHLLNLDFQPVITAICDTNPELFTWYQNNFNSIELATTSYQELISRDDIDAVYCAVPHNLHQQFYTDIIAAGKHMLGEKPFGIDQKANDAILSTIEAHSNVFVACSSEFPFYPGAHRVVKAIEDDKFGSIIDVEAGFLHSSDIDPHKTINWKRIVSLNGEYGCMGDLGMHVLHIPLRFGWMPENVRAVLSNLIQKRPDASGKMIACETWDNAHLTCVVRTDEMHTFPMILKTYRIAPGETNTWYIRINGTHRSVAYSTRYPKSFYTMDYRLGDRQVWCEESLGYDTAYPSITGSIFEFGISDSLLQMWAAFCDELTHSRSNMHQPFYCVTPQETAQHHRILSAALESHRQQSVVHL